MDKGPSEPEFPWRKVEFKRLRSRIGIACAQVRVKKCWYDIKITMDFDGFEALAAMPKRARYLLLDSLATLPIRHKELTERRGGLHNEAALMARYNAQWLGPVYLEFFKHCARLKTISPKTDEYERALDQIVWTRYHGHVEKTERDQFAQQVLSIYQNTQNAMQKESQEHVTPHGMAAFLVERQWCLDHSQWPTRPLPTEDPVAFFKALRRNKQFQNPIIPKNLIGLIEDILAGRSVPLILPPQISRPRFMTDFRSF